MTSSSHSSGGPRLYRAPMRAFAIPLLHPATCLGTQPQVSQYIGSCSQLPKTQKPPNAFAFDLNGPFFGSGLVTKPYVYKIELASLQRRRFKASLETTGGSNYVGSDPSKGGLDSRDATSKRSKWLSCVPRRGKQSKKRS